jgi:hypothetical protein
VARIESTPSLKEAFVDSRAPNHWDVSGIGQYQGLQFEITTSRAITRHADRWYGDIVEYPTYDRPDDYLHFLFDAN